MRSYWYALTLLCGTLSAAAQKTSMLQIRAIPAWQEFENRNENSTQRIIMCAQIHIHHRGAPQELEQIVLQWRPIKNNTPTPHTLTPLLYEQSSEEKAFTPTDNMLLSSGIWDQTARCIRFPLKTYKVSGQHWFNLILHGTLQDINLLRQGTLTYSDATPLIAHATA